jgi:hypothetical protein
MSCALFIGADAIMMKRRRQEHQKRENVMFSMVLYDRVPTIITIHAEFKVMVSGDC